MSWFIMEEIDIFFQELCDKRSVRAWLGEMQMENNIANGTFHFPSESPISSAHRPAHDCLYLDAPFRHLVCGPCDTGCCNDDMDDAINRARGKDRGSPPPSDLPPVISTYRSKIDTTGRLRARNYKAASTAAIHQLQHQPTEPHIPAPSLLPVF